METLVAHIGTLKMLEKAGHIMLHSQTGTKISGLYGGQTFTCYYIDDYKHPRFEHKGIKYHARYVDGCFCPYVFKVN